MEATLSTSQMICSHCEELVHRYAARCPYCQHDLTAPLVAMAELHFASATSSVKDSSPAPQTDLSASKITPLKQDIPQKAQPKLQPEMRAASKSAELVKPSAAVKPQSALPSFENSQVDGQVEPKQLAESSSQENLIKVLFALVALLGGSFFAFFGLMLKMFSTNGRLVLEWNAETWPYYLFPALVLLVFGMAMLSHGEQETV